MAGRIKDAELEREALMCVSFAPIVETCGCDESKALRAERSRLLSDLVEAHRTIAKLKNELSYGF